MKLLYKPNNFISEVEDEVIIYRLLRNPNYVVVNEPIPEVTVIEESKDVELLTQAILMIDEEKEYQPEVYEDVIELPKRGRPSKGKK